VCVVCWGIVGVHGDLALLLLFLLLFFFSIFGWCCNPRILLCNSSFEDYIVWVAYFHSAHQQGSTFSHLPDAVRRRS
jgi:hypothetical protein